MGGSGIGGIFNVDYSLSYWSSPYVVSIYHSSSASVRELRNNITFLYAADDAIRYCGGLVP